MTSTVRVLLPAHLRLLAKCGAEVPLVIEGAVTQCTVLDSLEAQFPMLQGTIRDHTTKRRRAFVRFFACEEDISNESIDAPLPEKVASGEELFMVIGALAGG
jgi:sulfur-carrier protein